MPDAISPHGGNNNGSDHDHDPLRQAIRYLYQHNEAQAAAVAIATFYRRLQKIAKHPFESKYRTLADNDGTFSRKIANLDGSAALLLHTGFVRSQETRSWELKASAEAWPRLMQATALIGTEVQKAEPYLQQAAAAEQQQHGNHASSNSHKSNSSSSRKTQSTAASSTRTSPTGSLPDAPLLPVSPRSTVRPQANATSSSMPPPPTSPRIHRSSTSVAVVPPSPVRSAAANVTRGYVSPRAHRASTSQASIPQRQQRLAQPAPGPVSPRHHRASTSQAAVPPSPHQQPQPRHASAGAGAVLMNKSFNRSTGSFNRSASSFNRSAGSLNYNNSRSSLQFSQSQLPPSNANAANAVSKFKEAALAAAAASGNKDNNAEASPKKHKKEKKKGKKSKKKAQAAAAAQAPPSPNAAAKGNALLAKFKAAAQAAKEQSQQQQQQQSSSSLPSSLPFPQAAPSPRGAKGKIALSKFKAAALAAGKQQAQQQSSPQRQTPQPMQGSPQQRVSLSQSRVNPLKAAAQHVIQQQQNGHRTSMGSNGGFHNNDKNDDDNSERSQRSVSLRDLALHNSATALHNSNSNMNLSQEAVSKLQHAAQNVHQAAAAKARFQQAAMAVRLQQQQQQFAQSSPDPKSRFLQAVHMARMQQQMQQANGGGGPPPPPPPPMDPRARFQSIAQQAMLQQQASQATTAAGRWNMLTNAALRGDLGPPPNRGGPGGPPGGGGPMSAAQRWKMATNAAQTSVRLQGGPLGGGKSSRMNAGWDGLSYPTSNDASASDGLSYPTASGDDVVRGVRRSKSFDDGGPPQRPFMLRTDSGRSLLSAASANSAPARNLMAAQSLRQLNNGPPGLVGGGPGRSRKNLMMHGGSVRNMGSSGPGGSRPSLLRENSMSLRDLQRSQSSFRGPPRPMSMRAGSFSSFGGMPYKGGSGGIVSSTPNQFHKPEQPHHNSKHDHDNPGPVVAAAGCNCIATAVNLVTAGELTLDLVTTILSFIQLSDEFNCCGNKVDYGALTLAVTIPYFFLVIVELIMLATSIFFRNDEQGKKKHAHGGSGMHDFDFDDESTVTVQWRCSVAEALSWVVCINPFLGCLITWTLMYEVDTKNDALLILGLEGAAIVLMFVTIYLERNQLSTCTMMIHVVPLVPFTVTCFVVWYFLEKGGICFIVSENTFWFEGCEICLDGWPPDENGRCPDGDLPTQDTYCGDTAEEQFCYFGY